MATARITAFRQWWHGESMPMAGIGGVVVAPEYRGRGVGRELMIMVLGRAAEHRYPLSALFPATVPPYPALRAWVGALEPDANLAQVLAGFVVEPVVEKREDTMAEYNLYALALHRPHLREATVDWDHALAEVLAARTDPLTGRMLAVLLCGLMMQTVLSDEPSTRSDVERLIARALGS